MAATKYGALRPQRVLRYITEFRLSRGQSRIGREGTKDSVPSGSGFHLRMITLATVWRTIGMEDGGEERKQ